MLWPLPPRSFSSLISGRIALISEYKGCMQKQTRLIIADTLQDSYTTQN